MRKSKKNLICWIIYCMCVFVAITCDSTILAADNEESINVEENVDVQNKSSDETEKTISDALGETNGNDNKNDEQINDGDNKKDSEPSQEKEISVEEIDLGDYQSEMLVGEKQLLVATILPTSASNKDIEYSSSDTSVASINGMGRIQALSIGETTISAFCDNVVSSFKLTVKNEDDKKVPVTDIEISDFEEKLPVGKIMTISAKVLPVDATDANITYKSENTAIATVNSSGEVKGIKKGDVTIFVSAGDITKRVNLKVVVDTKKISLNTDYVVLKPGNTKQIVAKVYPEESPQIFKYKSLDNSVAEVTDEGLITAKKVGNTSIVVSNGDLSVSVTVIVNSNGKTSRKTNGNTVDGDNINDTQEQIDCNDFIDSKKCTKVTKEMLKYLYENNKSTTIIGDGCTIRVDGDKILNYTNELSTDIRLSRNKKGNYEFVINGGKDICGEIFISFDSKQRNKIEGQKLFLYNKSKKKYEQIDFEDINAISITKAGKYRFSDMPKFNISSYKMIIVIGTVSLAFFLGCFVLVKKTYWFW